MNCIVQYAKDTNNDELQLVIRFLIWKNWSYDYVPVSTSPQPQVLLDNGTCCIGFEALIAGAKAVDLPPKRHTRARDATVGESLKNHGTNRVKNRYKAWVEAAIREIERVSKVMKAFTSDDLRHLAAPTKHCMGTAFLNASRRKIIRHIGWRPSTVPSCHAKRLMVWERYSP